MIVHIRPHPEMTTEPLVGTTTHSQLEGMSNFESLIKDKMC